MIFHQDIFLEYNELSQSNVTMQTIEFSFLPLV